MTLRTVTAILATATLAAAAPLPALADSGGGIAESASTVNGATVEVSSTGEDPPSSPGGNAPSKPSPYEDCRSSAPIGGLIPLAHLISEYGGQLPAGSSAIYCVEVATGNRVALLLSDNPVAAATLAAQNAFAMLTIDPPTANTAPRPDGLHLTGLRTWFWDTNTTPLTATATIPGLAATVTATPTTTTLTTDNTTTTCPNGGTPYNPTQPGTDQDQTCTHTYTTTGPHTATLTTTWTITWTATNGTTGTLPDLTRTTTITLDITSAEATTD